MIPPLLQLWRTVIGPSAESLAWWQVCDRAVIIFFLGIALIRVSGRRTFSRESPLEIIVAIVIGSNLSRALTGNAAFGPTLAATVLLVVLHRILAHACCRFSWLADLLKGDTLKLIEHGRLDPTALRRAGISDGDLQEALRQRSAAEIAEIRLAVLERSGQISVLKS